MEEFMSEIIVKAGDILMSSFGTAEIIGTKEKVTDIVTQADLASQEFLLRRIKEAYPEHEIISEELKSSPTSAEYVWIIDPLDGTRNFASRVTTFGINIALLQNGVMRHGAIYLPATRELCYAESGAGASLNGRPMYASQTDEWTRAYGLVAPDCGPEFTAFLQKSHSLSDGSGWINAIASPAACGVWVADGRRDWYIGPSANSWDYAAPALIAEEAGCAVSNFAGTPWRPGDRGLVLSARSLHGDLLEMVQASFQM